MLLLLLLLRYDYDQSTLTSDGHDEMACDAMSLPVAAVAPSGSVVLARGGES